MAQYTVTASRFRHVKINKDKTRKRTRYFRGDTIELTDQEAERLLAVGAIVEADAGHDDDGEATDEAPITPAARSGQTVEEGQDGHPASSAEGTLGGEADEDSDDGDDLDAEDEEEEDDDYESWSFSTLQSEAKERNLSAGGSKEDLVARLREDDAKSAE